MGVARKVRDLAAAEAFQWLPAPLVRRAQRARLARLLSFCAREVPFYRQRWRGLAPDADRLEALPILTREEVVHGSLRTRAPRPGDVVFRTSGSSGLFMEIAYDARANDYLDAVYARALFVTGYRPWHRLAYLWWEDEPKAPRVYERLGLMTKTMIPIDPDPRALLARLRAVQPDYVYAFPSAMAPLARLVDREPAGFAPRGVICHGELLPVEIRDAIARALRCPVWNQYGAQELNRIGWDCAAHDAMHLDADSVALEVVDERGRRVPDGEEGDLVLTGLVNRLMPLVRYRVGDIGRVVPGPCPGCRRGLPRFAITEGRRDDVLTLPDGRRVGPRVIAPRIERVPGFTQYRLVQTALASFELRVVPEAAAPPDRDAQLSRVLHDVLGPDVTIDVREVATIPLNRRGKLRKIVSEL